MSWAWKQQRPNFFPKDTMIGHFGLRRCGCEQQRVYKVSCYCHGLFVVFICVVGFLRRWHFYLLLMERFLFSCQIFVWCAWLMLIYYVTLFLMEKENERMGIGYVDCSEVQYVVKSKDLRHGHWIFKGNGFRNKSRSS